MRYQTINTDTYPFVLHPDLAPYPDALATDGPLISSAAFDAPTFVDSLDHGVTEAARRTRLPAGVSPHALRHASVSLYIRSGLPLEWASQAHGHVELLTTLEHYVHSAAERQRALMEAAPAGGRDIWLPLALAPRFLGVFKQAVYRRARRAPDSIRTVSSLSPEALRRGAGRDARYVSASALAETLRAIAKRAERRMAAADTP